MTSRTQNAPTDESASAVRAARRTLVTGGVRSGKSSYAERRAGHADTTYLATGPTRPGDAAWCSRVAAHQQRRPRGWSSVESVDVVGALAQVDGPCLLDDVGSWLTAALDECGAWNDDESDPAGLPAWREAFERRADAFVGAVEAFEHDLVIVTNEVGFSLVSPYHSGRVFTDELGRMNQRLAQVCDDVVLVVAGCPLVVKNGGGAA